MLPGKYNDMPLFFSEKYCELLKGSFSLSMLITRNQTIEKQYNRLVTLYPKALTNVSLEDFKWGRTAIITRVFSCASKDDDENVREECLVPMADMMNHDARPSSTWGYDRTKKGFLMSANRTILKGSELSDSYGLKCNSRYFINYGFTIPDNHSVNQADIFVPYNERLYNLGVTSDSYDDGFSGYDSMLEGVTETKVSGEGYNRFQISTINELTKGSRVFNSIRALFNCARLIVDNRELQPVKVDGITRRILLTIEVPAISEENERLALKLIASCCKDRLGDFPTSLEEDLKSLKVSVPFTAENNISTMLSGEKRVLEWYIELSEFFSDNFHKNLKKSLKGSEKFKYYYEIFWKK
jgi:histone-lysine N-methyltransferase SETD3